MRVIHVIDAVIKSNNSTPIENMSTESNLEINKLIAKLDKRIAVLEKRQEKTQVFKKYILWEDKINALKVTKKALLESTFETKIRDNFKKAWNAGLFSSKTKRLVDEAARILHKPKR